jgi:aminobenzoyl-glutamate utilization protein B
MSIGQQSGKLIFLAATALAAAMVPLLGSAQTSADNTHALLQHLVDADSPPYVATSKMIWDNPELGFLEQKSSALLQDDLSKAGFKIRAGVAGQPTAFVASYGHGTPVIGILGEFDALPGLSQEASPVRKPRVAGAPGHACGHNLLGSGAALAAVALKQYLDKNHIEGTLRYYGTPAEEGGGGKVFMVRDGLFKDVDVVLTWHPGDRNAVVNGGALAMAQAYFTFNGVAAHAAAAPDRGRSALDAVMLMGNGVEFLREHVPSNARMHYIITHGGDAPNVVPAYAQMELQARSPYLDVLKDIWDRIDKIAQGAALMTGTTMDAKLLSAYANMIPNDTLAGLSQRDLEEVGGFSYTDVEQRFAAQLQTTLPAGAAARLDGTRTVAALRPFDPNAPSASTDVGDVSWQVPTMTLTTATFVPGVAAHTWQAAATAGMSIGQRGMVVAAKALTLIGADLFADPQLVKDAKRDFARQTQGKVYTSMMPADQPPPLDYRRKANGE